MMLHGLGDVASSCGPNPCGLMDSLFPSAACETWQTCAASANAPVATGGGPCIVGAVDANGNTIVSCGGAPPCLTGPGPLQPGQEYCAGVDMTPADPTADSPIGTSHWVLLGGVALLLVMIAGRR